MTGANTPAILGGRVRVLGSGSERRQEHRA